MKTYIANTPLILEDADGREYRVDAGEVVDLMPEEYQLVAAHVTPAEISEQDLAVSGYRPDGGTPLDTDPPADPQTPPETPLPAETDGGPAGEGEAVPPAGQDKEPAKGRGSRKGNNAKD